MPPFWFRPSFRDFLATSREPDVSLPVAVAALAVLVLVLAALLVAARRWRDDVVGPAAATALVALVGALFTAARIPIVPGFGEIDPHVYRWLWPLAAFFTFVVLLALVRHAFAARPVVVGSICAALALGFGVANIPTSDQGAVAQTSVMPVVRDLGRQLAALHGRGPILVDVQARGFADLYPSSVLAALQGAGVPFVLDDEVMLHQVGQFRRYNGKKREMETEYPLGRRV